MIEIDALERLKTLRQRLHSNPELSGFEHKTASQIRSFIEEHYPTTILQDIGGSGLAAVYEFENNGPSIAIRCELDALPIDEMNDFAHKSKTHGISHKCGHDGHMTIVAGMIFWIKNQDFKDGRIILLFQPAEETGKGAKAMIEDPRFASLGIDYIFSLHNIPGEDKGDIILMDRGFSAEVKSFSIELSGITSHASEPEKGNNPSIAISELIAELDALQIVDPDRNNFQVVTPVYVNLGSKAYGISPGKGEIHYTIRTWDKENMLRLEAEIKRTISTIAKNRDLRFKVNWFEHFPAATNHPECNNIVEQAAKRAGLSIVKRAYPFKFGEDFGWFSKNHKTSMFGLGAGKETPPLHHPTYDFPDQIIEAGIKMFARIIEDLLKLNE